MDWLEGARCPELHWLRRFETGRRGCTRLSGLNGGAVTPPEGPTQVAVMLELIQQLLGGKWG